ncbi:hypothetical protein BDQ17DRAFT_1460559 [Cyathus striatus]|nr:hypothetical protein BDQ17DRAFT_1460559 [Cyathus striatus]
MAPLIPPLIPIDTLLVPSGPSCNSQVESELSSALNDLVTIGALQSCNRMSIEELCNPCAEQEIVSKNTTDEDIFKAVMEMMEGEQMREKNGGDDGVVDLEETEEARPMHRDVLVASLAIQKYLSDSTEPNARRLKQDLARFSCQVHMEESANMVPTTITQYFSR